jgi:methylated-DNA-[protein]-cysteine S-methyltransferase
VSQSPCFALFETAIGRCGIAWGDEGIVGLQLPEAGVRAARDRLQRRFPGAREEKPSAAVARVIDDVVALLAGEARDLSKVALDMRSVAPFHRQVYEAARTIPAGKTLTYGEIATRIGAPGSARAVGQALGRNPFPIVVPCHACSPRAGRPGGSPPKAASTPSSGCSRSKGQRPAGGSSRGSRRSGSIGTRGSPTSAPSTPGSRAVIAAAPPGRLELKKTRSLFGALAEAIVYQQLSGKAAATIYGRVCALFPRAASGPTAAHILGATDARLRGAGLSGAKVLSIKDLARRAKAGGIPTLAEARGLDDDAIVERLTEVRGIGRWTAEML